MNFSMRTIGVPLVILIAMAGVFMAKYMTRQPLTPSPSPSPAAAARPAQTT